MMKQVCVLCRCLSSLLFYGLGISEAVKAQIVPDTTLPANSTVTASDNQFLITGGTRGGNNLFHSFKAFSLPTGGTAYFNNALEVQNIFTRVTGGSVSQIDGILKANGTANLFLLNPNGIIFGANARLNLGGSFFASTANAIQFADRTQFSAIATPRTPSLLTVSVPIGLQYGSNPGSIINRARAIEESDSAAGLQVATGKTLALIGGNVQLEGGTLRAPGGRIELGGLSESGVVDLKGDENNLSLSFPEGVARADTFLTQGAIVDVRARGGGSIAIAAQNLHLSAGSRLLAGIEAKAIATGNRAGDIEINATGAIAFDGVGQDAESTGAYNLVESKAEGEGGNINVTANTLSLTNGASIKASTFGRGRAGDVNLRIGSTLSLDGAGSNTLSSGVYSRVEDNDAIGNGGNINIVAGSLSVTNGAVISASTQGRGNAGNIAIAVRTATLLDGLGPLQEITLPDGEPLQFQQSSGIYSSVKQTGIGAGGNIQIVTGSLSLTNGALVITRTEGEGRAGNIVVNAADFAIVDGVGSDLSSSGLLAPTEAQATGRGGDITVKAKTFRVSNGAVVNSQTLNDSDGGDISISTQTFEALGGGQVIATTQSSGRAGNVAIAASERLLLSGSDPNFARRASLFDTNIVGNNEGAASGLFASTGKQSTGPGGNLTVRTGRFIAEQGAEVTVSATGSGAAGNLRMAADSIRLDNATITATTSSGNFGNIRLESQDLQLRHNSQIATNASGTAGGGNIDIETGVLVALENSDISANSPEARGGQIAIAAQSIFGTQYQSQGLTPNSDITATGGTPALSGTVTIRTPNFNPASSLLLFPQTPVDVDDLVDRRCSTGNPQRSRFQIVGRGGMPPHPQEALSESRGWVDRRALTGTSESRSALFPSADAIGDRWVEAQGWIVNPRGQVELVADLSGVQPHRLGFPVPACEGDVRPIQ